MFHVKRSPDSFFKEKMIFLNQGGAIEGCTPSFLGLFLLSTSRPACVYIHDNLFNLIHEQNRLSWDNDGVLWVPPQSIFADDVPAGFNSLYSKSMALLRAVSSSLWDDVKLIACSSSQKKLKLNKEKNLA